MELHIFLRIIVRHKWTIILLCLSATLHAVLFTYLIPEKYEATALVLIKPEERIALSPATLGSHKEVVDIPATVNISVETPSKTYIEVIKSRAVAEKVVRILNLDKKKRAPAANYYRELWERMKDYVTESLTTTWGILRYGRVLNVDPFEKAVQRLMKNMSLTSIKNTYLFEIKFQSKDPEEAAAVANTAAQMFLEYSSGASQIEARTDREFVEKKLIESERELADARQALREAKEQNKSISFEEETKQRIQLIADLESSLEKTEAELSGLLEQYRPSHPKVMKLLAKKEKLSSSITQRKNELQNLPEKESELAKLKLNVRTTETTYELLKKEFEEIRIREAKNTREIRLASPATAPPSPNKPIKVYYAGVSLLLALMTGVGLAVFCEVFDKRLESVESVEKSLGLPVIATIPTARH